MKYLDDISKLQLIKNKNIESIYPLSHLQQGMLFHTLHEPESGVYFEQFCLTLSGNLDINSLQQTCARVVKRHPVLRTLVVWKKQEKPLQIVCKQVELHWQICDWRSLSEKTKKEHLEAFLQRDRIQGFVLDKAPLMRFSLIRVADDTYEFIWSFHHLLIDGWSLSILCKEFFAFYNALIKSEYLYLNTPRPYRNYINWLQQQDLIAAEKFWQQQLQGFTSPTRLLLNRGELQHSPQPKTYHEHQCSLSATITAALHSQAQQYHLTVSTFIQAAWAILLSRYTDESELVFGATVSGRPPTLSGVESMVGLFINTLPVRVKVPTATSLWRWLRELQAQQIERSQYSWFPLVDIQANSEIPQDLPLFESIVVFENYPQNPLLSNPGASIQITKRRVIEQTNYPLTVIALPGQELSLRILYDGSRFDEKTITRMMGHLVTLLEAMVTNIEQTVPEISMLTAAEQQQILVWNDTQTDYPQKCIAQLFAEQVKRTPDTVAVSFQSQQLTYRELNCQANQLAHHLQNLGVKPEVRVGICVERSLAMVVGILAILKAGGAYVPLDPRSPQERLSYMLSDSQASVLLTDSSISLSQPSLTVVCLDKSEIFCHNSQENPASEVTPDNLAYVMYTSGSTGKPKGVAMSHRSLANLLHWQMGESAVNFAKTLQFASISFDVSFQEIFSTLCSGGTLVLITAEIQKDGFALLQLIAQENIERLFLPFVALQQLAHAASITQIYPASLRQIITAGEQLQITPDLVKFFEQLPGCTLQNQYGPTESHVVTSFTLQDSVSNWPQLPPIGRAIANTQIYILDRNLQPLPIGVPGELYIGGVAIARSYINSPELTAEKFIAKDGSRLYKTGDRARYLPDGNIEFLGRIDNQVKVRGFRIELGEIETVLAAHPQVREAVVIAREDQLGNKRLVAYIVPKQHLDTSELLCYLKQKLPEYMLPSAFVKLLDALPLTPSGKTDRRALPEPTSRETRNVSTDSIPPRTATEDVIAGIWSDVLELEQVGIHDNFFALGGHSLSAMQVIARLRETFKMELPISWLFDYPTIVELDRQISEYRQKEAGEGGSRGAGEQGRNNHSFLSPFSPLPYCQNDFTLSLKPVPRNTKELPISLTQLEFWILAQLNPGIPVYNIALAYRLTGLLNVNALVQSLVEIVRRHEALRTTFTITDKQVVQKIIQEPILPFSVIDLRKLSESKTERKALAQRFVTEEKNQPFDLEQSPLLRIKLLRLSDAEHLLIVTIHHLVFDGWSVGVFLQELTKLYAAFYHGQPSPLPDLPIQYADFAHWQQQWVARPAFVSELDYWKQQLSNSTLLLELPSNRPRLPLRTFQGASQTFIISKSLTNALKHLSQQHNVTLFVTLLTAFKIVLFYYTGQSDIIVGAPFANRQQVKTKELIGCFINTLPIRTYLGGDPSLSELLYQVRGCFLAACDRQQIPFVKLVEVLQPKREPSHSLLYQVMFNFLPPSDLKLTNLTVYPWSIETNTAEFDWDIYLQQTTLGSIEGKWCYKIDLFDTTTISRVVTQFLVLLELLINNPECRLSDLGLLFQKHNSQCRA
ncbi:MULTISPECIES: non-ribosomal peptide synthetase [unclassified Nostoc]|uniref:non-ribosomal peptide synthetase n=1 Tax=unclassified Nostoc TaxID=2593658 RepID=UPI002AD30EC9|nr:non-ribosomal peptide synthetase [Nostoc sp. DedQUE03]MDZ7976372.1 amino acid adenylation domain-containing protein [Nostoc sp. DedQUE03]MDZ8047986.1 amino acid adenylation domain-containing protein [Nostoc sp. DedQUE02]